MMKKKSLLIIFCSLLLAVCALFTVLTVTATETADYIPPTISVDFKGYDFNNLPKGQVGFEYPVFKAKAIDTKDGERNVDVNVSIKGSNRNIYNEGTNSFIPSEKGTYILTYKATDVAGNLATQNFVITVSEQVKLPEILCEADSSYSYSTGEEIDLIYATATGGSGNLVKELAVKLGNDTVYTSSKFDKNKFVPEKSGTYSVVYKATDYLMREVTTSYTIEVSNSYKPVIPNLVFPKTVVCGYELSFNEFVGIDYSMGVKHTTQDSVKINFDGKDTVLSTDEIYTVPSVGEKDTSSELTLTLISRGVNATQEKTYSINVVNTQDGKKVYLPAYMIKENATELLSNEETNYGMAFTLNEDGAKLTFAKEVLANSLVLGFTPSNIYKINIVLTDSFNQEQQVVLTLEISESNTSLKLNGERLPVASIVVNNDNMLVGYENGYLKANTSGGSGLNNIANITKYVNGKPFNGFDSGKVTFSLEFEKIYDDAKIVFSKINNVAISKNSTIADSTQPEILPVVIENNRLEKGEEFVLPAIISCDVLSNISVATVTLTAPDGTKILNNVDSTKSYTVKAEQYGTYSIIYTSVDSSNQKNSKTYRLGVYVVDRIAPEVKANGSVASSIKLNRTVKLPAIIASDNTTVDEDLIKAIIVIDPDYHFEAIFADEKGNYYYTFKLEGVYTVRYYAEDYDGNRTFRDYTVKVGG